MGLLRSKCKSSQHTDTQLNIKLLVFISYANYCLSCLMGASRE